MPAPDVKTMFPLLHCRLLENYFATGSEDVGSIQTCALLQLFKIFC
jgi:hypothetical protein